MAQYKNLNVKFSNLQFSKLKLEIKISTELTLKLLSNLVIESYD